MTGDGLKPGHPTQRKDLELSVDGQHARNSGLPTPKLDSVRSDNRIAVDLMRQMGFEPNEYMTPLQFLLAVMNDDVDLIYKDETKRARAKGKGGMALSYRIEAAKTAAKYMHMQLPSVQITNQAEKGFGEELSNAIAAGTHRVVHRETIIREIEQISPDIPLAPASYPPDFLDAEYTTGEGDMDYDPDRDDGDPE